MKNCSNEQLVIKEKMRHLYRACFEDSDEYIEYFFMNKYAHTRIYTHFENGELASGLHIIIKQLKIADTIIDLPYIVAAATYPQYRNKGYMRELILQVARDYAPLVALYPFSHKYYEQFGFFSINYVLNVAIVYNNTKDITISELQANNAPLLNKLYKSFIKDYDIYLSRSDNDFFNKINETYAAGGKCIIINENNFPIGYALYDKEEIIETTLDYMTLCNIRDLNGYIYNQPSTIGIEGVNKNVMFMITDIKLFNNIIKKCWFAQPNTNIAITDKLIVKNNLSFSVDSDNNIVNKNTAICKSHIATTASSYGESFFKYQNTFVMEKY